MRVEPLAMQRRERGRGLLTAAGVMLGMGLAAFFDGIVFHQLLQWHHMASSVPAYPPDTIGGLEANTFFDGLFHVAAYVVTALGLFLLWRALRTGGAQLRSRRFLGALLLGAGGFNVVEGLVNHFALNLHHVREGPNALVYDIVWLLLSAVVAGAGAYLLRSADRGAEEREERLGERAA